MTTNLTHLSPGARLELDRSSLQSGDVVVLISDGAAVEAVFEPAAVGFTLRVDEYRTAVGASIPAKTCGIEWEAGETLRVVRPVSA